MDSDERRRRRFLRRKAERDARRAAALAAHPFDGLDRDALYKAAAEAGRRVGYKASVQRYSQRVLVNTAIADGLIKKGGGGIHKGFICFYTMERGKMREIMSTRFSERVVHKAFNQAVLLPVMERSLIFDNGASRKGKGTSFAVKRLTQHLRRFYREHGSEGYVLKGDIKGYFASIDHAVCKEQLRRAFDDERTVSLACRFIDSYREHAARSDPAAEAKGLGLGSEINQTLAVAYLSPLDHFVKEALRVKGYGRYNDDFYLLGPTREGLLEKLEAIRRKLAALKLELGEGKTKVAPLSEGFVFLKTRFSLTAMGRVLRRPCREALTRERRRLKGQKRLFDAGALPFECVRRSYQSWRGSMKRKDAGRAVRMMDGLFNKLFIKEWSVS